ncbi:MAG: GNAT family N-acetyltransferase [Acidobacteria bacterium]|nr:GNAT family N-acetyltransferase [Acidobacteriota bacterium]
MSPFSIRRLSTLDECRRVAALEKVVWGLPDSEDVVPSSLLIASIKRGAILLGAFDGEALRGFVYSLPAVKEGRLTHWSHMLGVAPEVRGQGLGLQLKRAQRDHAIAIVLDLIEWTFDPLQALNAHFNFTRLGVVVEEYEQDMYGQTGSPLHFGTPTDRFVAEWRLTAPHVERRVSLGGAALIRDQSVMSAAAVTQCLARGEWLTPSMPRLDLETRRLTVEIPTDFTEMQSRQPHLAMEWRLNTRSIFQTYLPRGYRVVDFFLAREARRGQYLLAQKTAT